MKASEVRYINPPFKVVCINDKNRPSEIPEALWVKEKRIYTVTEAVRLKIGTNPVGFKLAELPLPASCYPYEFFAPHRFAVIDPKNEAEIIAALEEETLEEVCQNNALSSKLIPG